MSGSPSTWPLGVQGAAALPVYDVSAVNPANSSISCVAGTKAAAGLNTLLAAPGAGKQIYIYTIIIQNETGTPTTIELQDVVARWRMLLQNQGDKLFLSFDTNMPWKLSANTALSLWLSGANSHGFSIQYSIENVQA